MLATTLFVTALAQAAPPLRLAHHRPVACSLELWVDPRDTAFHGVVELDVALDRPSRTLWLDAVELDVTSATVTAGDASFPAEVRPDADQRLRLRWDDRVSGTVRVRLAYTGTIQDEPFALFRQEEPSGAYAFTQLEATYARQVFPGFDQPDHKIPWTLTLHVPEGMGAFANARIASDDPEPDGHVVRFAPTAPLPSYLVAFAVGDLEVVDLGTAGRAATPLGLIVPRGRGVNTAFAAETVAPILEDAEAWFDAAYPFDKLDVVGIPSTLGFSAMENPGLITIELGLLAPPPDLDTRANRREWAETFAHELAHQWFGNLVTPVWWDDLWLNEAFASWLGTSLTQARWPEWRLDVARVAWASDAMGFDAVPGVRRIREPIRALADIEEAFDAITYSKGQAVLEMVEAWVGAESFRDGTLGYLSAHAGGTATTDDFLEALSAASGRDVAPVLGPWLDQPGVPIVDVQVRCDPTPSLHLSQRRLVLEGRPGRNRWKIPLQLALAVGSEVRPLPILLDRREQVVPLAECPDRVRPRLGGLGYYRARIDEETLRALLAADSGLEAPERVALLGDAAARVAAGDLDPLVVLEAVPGLVALGESLVTTETVSIVAELDADLVPADLRQAHARFVEQVYGGLARELGMQPGDDDSDADILVRGQLMRLLARVAGSPWIVEAATDLAEHWLQTGEGIHPTMLGSVLQIALAHDEGMLFTALVGKVHAETDRDRRRLLLGALGAVADPDRLRSALGLALDRDIQLVDAIALLRGPLARPEQRPIAWQWVVDHLDAIEERVPGPFRSYLVQTGMFWCDLEHRDAVQGAFASRARRWMGGKRALAGVLAEIERCAARSRSQEPAIRTLLEPWRAPAPEAPPGSHEASP